MKLALIGCGRWGSRLARVFDEIGVLDMIVDPAMSSVMPGLTYGAEWADDVRFAFGSSEVTAVAIATPPETHYDLTMRALQAGKDVLVEKPMALTSDHARNMVACALAYDRILMVGHVLEYDPAIVATHQNIGDAGVLRHIEVRHGKPNDRQRGPHESALWSLAPHDIAVVLRLAGMMPYQVQGLGDQNDANIYLSFEGDLTATLHASLLWPHREHTLIVAGSERTGAYHIHNGSYRVYHNGSLQSAGLAVSSAALRLECEAFVEACNTRVQPRTDGESGVRVVEILERADAWVSKD